MRSFLFEAYMMSKTHKRKVYPGTFELFAIIAKGGKKIASGQNHAERSSKLIEKNKIHEHCLIHAEVDAILEGRKAGCDLTGSTIYVARVYRKDGNSPAMARPCEMCRKILFQHGIKKCYYTIDENHYGKLMIYNSHNDCTDKIYSINES